MAPVNMDRRRFVKLSAATTAGLASGAWLRPWPSELDPGRSDGSDPLIVVIGADSASDFGRGALLGIEEGERSARLLRSPLGYEVVTAPAAGWSAAIDAVRSERVRGAVAALDDPAMADLEAAAADGSVLLDARAEHGREEAIPGVFRTGVPARAYRRAVDQAGGTGDAVLWHDELFRYGATQLNERYRRRFDAGMTGAAWAAWMAVKALTEAALRSPGGGRDGLIEALAGPRAAFDGHKGTPLTFTGPGASLAQPLYVLGPGGSTAIDWPVRGG